MSDHVTEVGIVLYPGAQMAAVLGLTDLFATANRVVALQRFNTVHTLRISHWQDGDRVHDTMPEAEASPEVLIVPPTLGKPIPREVARAEAPFLRARHAEGVTLSSICTGAFVLGETGLLDGRTITTHWTFDHTMRERFPKVRLDLDRMVIEDGDLITGGGAMSWVDVGLKIVDRILGPDTMIRTAQTLLVDPPHREQRYYSGFAPNLTHGDAAVLKVQHWLEASDAKEVELTRLVTESGLESRTFLRRFKKATGLTTTDYIQRLRMRTARELLQFGAKNVDQIAWEVGYSDPGAFRKVFSRIVGLSPAEYRRRFHA
ncbi:GlxA family transcriptional regulator [Paracoccus laeviglucosivorans]|uniref:Transcriptional regulator GlxA family, contains an amidase domain and an AraC-type DNA-binding HTH domain n=1 Tax=Paracoccus laeviglucosivorans TaxID=1197861 RepID=A0A521FNK4_9RHOB|nr:helix-turn-helix domain-containing protein [Paracoccus laeviglucosivorans]SMO97742.1 Transcriptional regulator GlxA family, contains an amidase domain and an AraC-type DNA-binding HTH domain [Paracoccus laeviglucosivorans]